MNASRLIKLKTVLEYCALSKATLYRQIKAGRFPEPVRITGGWDDSNAASLSCVERGRNTAMDSQPSESTAVGHKKKLSEKVHRSNSTLYAHLYG